MKVATSAEEARRRGWPMTDAPADADLALERASVPAPRRELVWIAQGLHRRWRVVSESRSFGEWDDGDAARSFLELLVAGNDDLERLPT